MNIDSNFFKKRRKKYLHFDNSIDSLKIFNYVTNPIKIQSHAFFPFIHFDVKMNKVKKSKDKKNLETILKIRPIKYASHIDSHIYSYYSHLLSEHYEKLIYEENINDSILAFRKLQGSPNNIHFAKNVFDEIKNQRTCAVICLDVKSFFDELDHSLLKTAWKKTLKVNELPKDHYKVFKSITKYSYVYRDEILSQLGLNKNSKLDGMKRLCTSNDFRVKIRNKNLINVNSEQKGIPQGSPISALLSNIYMIDFDKFTSDLLNEIDGKYYRYCDDILIICPIKEYPSVLLNVIKRIKRLKLEIQDSKTKISIFNDGVIQENNPLQYLGFTFDGQQILLRHSGLAQYSYKSAKAIRMSYRKLVRINSSRLRRNKPSLTFNKKHIYRKFSYIGKRNYISYALRASKIMEESAIKKQIKPHWKKIKRTISYYEGLYKDEISNTSQ
ncbi:antiviral reverse transcriptase Drt2 [Acinetobacter sp. YH12144]|uniref:antiviral reverse transcriptase Drt2 n=1 Tax=Acinetobacter sp. YH12144 TaxID=2601128 RepID=UPI0015D1604F|nr:antiviral reverse transcriptase Drt2 [Acinetobacter sp. YH12144]